MNASNTIVKLAVLNGGATGAGATDDAVTVTADVRSAKSRRSKTEGSKRFEGSCNPGQGA